MNTISWVLFDLGGVVLSVEQARIFAELSRLTGRDTHVVSAALLTMQPFWDSFIVTEYSPRQLAAQVNVALGSSLSEEEIVSAFNAELGEIIHSTVELIPSLQKRVQVGCLSNTNSIHWDHMLRTYPVMQNFDRRFASQLVGHSKPSAEIYRRVVEYLDVKPGEILFFDDKQENVDIAQRLGWHACVYSSSAGLTADLRRFSLID